MDTSARVRLHGVAQCWTRAINKASGRVWPAAACWLLTAALQPPRLCRRTWPSVGSARKHGCRCSPAPLLLQGDHPDTHGVNVIRRQPSAHDINQRGPCVHSVGLTVTTLPHIMRLRSFVKQVTRSTRAGRLLGGPVSTRHWGLEGEEAEQFRAAGDGRGVSHGLELMLSYRDCL